MKVLVACECSQTVCVEFRKLGVECYSCDIEKEYGNHPEWHIQGDVLKVLHGDCEFTTNDGKRHYIGKWDLVVAHPPCTYFCMAQNGLYDRKRFGDEYVDRRVAKQSEAFKFFLEFTKLGVPTVIENPPGKLTTLYRKANQTIQPYQFGDSATKATCLWLFGLPKLQPTKQVAPPCSCISIIKPNGRVVLRNVMLASKRSSPCSLKDFSGHCESACDAIHKISETVLWG